VRRFTLADVQAEELKKVAAELGEGHEVLTVVVDVSNEEQVDKMVEDTVAKFGRLDYAANCAGISGMPDSMATFSSEMYDKVIAVNQRGIFLCVRAQLKAMAAQSPLEV
jgi:NAD(P)-dependent dehydrogenase (short-subunit alcohol dehydrogenase family)